MVSNAARLALLAAPVKATDDTLILRLEIRPLPWSYASSERPLLDGLFQAENTSEFPTRTRCVFDAVRFRLGPLGQSRSVRQVGLGEIITPRQHQCGDERRRLNV